VAVAEQLVRAIIGSRELVGPGWRLAVQRPIERAGRLGLWGASDGWVAVLGIRRGLTLLVTGEDERADLSVEAWAGEPDASDGVAVVELAGGGAALARVPLCSCGDRGCGNAGVQFGKQLPADDLPALASLLRALPWSDAVPSRSDVLRGESLAALPM
jgi:hypothetical protein